MGAINAAVCEGTADKLRAAFRVTVSDSDQCEFGTFTFVSSCHVRSESSFMSANSICLILWPGVKTLAVVTH